MDWDEEGSIWLNFSIKLNFHFKGEMRYIFSGQSKFLAQSHAELYLITQKTVEKKNTSSLPLSETGEATDISAM